MNRECDTIDIGKEGIGKYDLQIECVQLGIGFQSLRRIFFLVRKNPIG